MRTDRKVALLLGTMLLSTLLLGAGPDPYARPSFLLKFATSGYDYPDPNRWNYTGRFFFQGQTILVEADISVDELGPRSYILGTREFPWHRFITLELWSYDPQTKKVKDKIPVEFTHLPSKDIVFFDDRGFQILEEGHGSHFFWALPQLEEGVYRVVMLFDNRNAKELPPQVWRGRFYAHWNFGVKKAETTHEQAIFYRLLGTDAWERPEEAWEMFKKSYELEPTEPRASYALGLLAIRFERYEEALQWFEEYLKYGEATPVALDQIRFVKQKLGLLPKEE